MRAKVSMSSCVSCGSSPRAMLMQSKHSSSWATSHRSLWCHTSYPQIRWSSDAAFHGLRNPAMTSREICRVAMVLASACVLGILERFQDRYTLSALLRGRRSLGSRRLECIPFGYGNPETAITPSSFSIFRTRASTSARQPTRISPASLRIEGVSNPMSRRSAATPGAFSGQISPEIHCAAMSSGRLR